MALLAWRVASQARPRHASDPHITWISSAHATPAATTERNAWRRMASGRSNTSDTNAAVVSTMYALVTAASRPPPPAPPPVDRGGAPPAPRNSGVWRGPPPPDGGSDAGPRVNHAAQGRPTRLARRPNKKPTKGR